MRRRIFEIVEKATHNDRLSAIYDYCMMGIITISIIPLAFKNDSPTLIAIDKITVAIFIIDYMLRWITADFKLSNQSVGTFLKYPFTPMALIDLLSILPSLSIINRSFKVLRVLRMLRAMRVLRVFKAMRYSRSFAIIGTVLHKSKDALIAVCMLAGGYILISALVIYNVEPDSFETFFEAIYWATVSLTTVGYGDIYPISTMGRVITMLSSIFGIAVVALPAGIITAGYMEAIQREKKGDQSEQ